jgi:hypothetical protein
VGCVLVLGIDLCFFFTKVATIRNMLCFLGFFLSKIIVFLISSLLFNKVLEKFIILELVLV